MPTRVKYNLELLQDIAIKKNGMLVSFDGFKTRDYSVWKCSKGTRSDLKDQYPGLIGFLRRNGLLLKFYKEFGIKMASGPSRAEVEFREWIRLFYPSAEPRWFKIKTSTRSTRREIDVFIPEINTGFEFNGLLHHSECRKKDKNYHKQKRELLGSIGITLIQINADEWLKKRDAVKSLVLNKIGKTPDRLYARKLRIDTVSGDTARHIFL